MKFKDSLEKFLSIEDRNYKVQQKKDLRDQIKVDEFRIQ